MKQLIPMDDYGIFCDSKDTARANSLMVAKMFGKDHNKVLRDIRELDCSEEFSLSNFGQSTYTDERGKRKPCVNMTRDGFTFLVMGYRGKKSGAVQRSLHTPVQPDGGIHPDVGGNPDAVPAFDRQHQTAA